MKKLYMAGGGPSNPPDPRGNKPPEPTEPETPVNPEPNQ